MYPKKCRIRRFKFDGNKKVSCFGRLFQYFTRIYLLKIYHLKFKHLTEKGLPYQILGGKPVKNVPIDPQTMKIWPKQPKVILSVSEEVLERHPI